MTTRSSRARGARAARVVTATIAVAAVLVGCATSTAPAGPGGVRADAPGPPEITAGPASSPLPAGTPGQGTPPVMIGTKDFPEQFLLGELYAQALRAKGFSVTLQQNIGDSEIIDSAFDTGRIQMYPEYLGEIASGLAHAPVTDSPLGTYQQARQFEQTQRAATVLRQTPFQDTDVIVVRRDLADRYGLRAVPDLAAIGPGGDGVQLAAQPPFRARSNGLVGMQQVYGLTNVTLLAVDAGDTYGALDAGQVDAADGFSTDAQLSSGRYVELDDPRTIFGFQYVAPVVKQATLDRAGPAFAATCDWVSSLLTVDRIRAMNQQVQRDGADEAKVAAGFLAAQGLR